MKFQLIVIYIVMVAVAGQAGCLKPADQLGSVSETKEQKFPDFLVGTWQTDKSKWRFTFEPSGRISRFTHFGGMEFDVEKGFLTEKWRGTIEANYFLGPCEAKYDPESRQLTLKIVIENYVIDNGGVSMLEGNFHDQLTGTISEDGKNWQVRWTGKGEVVGGGLDNRKPVELAFTKDRGKKKVEEN